MIKEQIDALNMELGTTGMGVAAAVDGEVRFTYSYGKQNTEKDIPVTEDTLFRAASVSKHMSAMVLMALVDKGLADLDADIGDYLGYTCRNPFYPDVPITLRHLMTHTSTYIEGGAYDRICAGDLPAYKLSEVLPFGAPGFTEDSYLRCAPGKQYSYSSFGSGIMGCIGEKISGKKFAELAKELLFDPIGIQASYDPRMLTNPEMVAVSYEPKGIESDSPEATKILREHQEWLAKSLQNKQRLYDLPIGEAYRIAQGNVHIRAKDVLEVQYVLMHDGRAKNGTRVLSKAAVDEMLKVQFTEKAGGPSDAQMRAHDETRGHEYRSRDITVGLNLVHTDSMVEGVHIVGHSGRADGVFTGSWFCPESRIGAAIMTNGTNPKKDHAGQTYAIGETFRIIYEAIGAAKK